MAIAEILANTTPMDVYQGMATKVAADIFTPPAEVIEATIGCDYVQLPYSEIVFAHADNDWWKNDKSEFLYKRYIAADTVAIELWKDDAKIEDLNDSDYGTFFNGFTAQPLYVGFLVDWQLVYLFYGTGNYTVKAQTVILGQNVEVVSRVFTLMKYTVELAHNTVRIESTQNGNIIGNIFDFTDLDWYQSIRVGGVFGNPRPIYSNENYMTESRQFSQIQAKMTREFDLNLRPIPFEVVEKIIYNKVLANSILITDYNIFAETEWRRVAVVLKEVSKRDIKNLQNKIYDLQFIDNKEFYVKRNY